MSGYRYQRGDGGGYFPISSDDILNALGFLPKAPVGIVQSVAEFDTRTTAAATSVLSSINSLRTGGYSTVGDFGAARYSKVGGSTLGGFQSADGQWWGIAEPIVTPQMFGALGGGDLTTQIQNAIDFQNTNHSAGVVFFPPGSYTVTSITIKGGVRVIGSGRNFCTIGSPNTDTNTIMFDSSCSYPLLEGLFVEGYLNAAATSNAVTVTQNIPAVIRDCTIWGGSSGLFTKGVDGYIENCYIAGYTANITSNGANWYVRCKIDTAALGTPTNGYNQGNFFQAGICENHFVQCDFSGNFTNSVTINDGGAGSATTTFEGCVFSQPIVITNAKLSMFSACEIGGSFTVGANPTCITGCASVSGALTVSGAGKILAGNYNIS